MYPQIFRNLAHGQDLRRNGRLFLTFHWLNYFSFKRHRFGVYYSEKARVARANIVIGKALLGFKPNITDSDLFDQIFFGGRRFRREFSESGFDFWIVALLSGALLFTRRSTDGAVESLLLLRGAYCRFVSPRLQRSIALRSKRQSEPTRKPGICFERNSL